MPGFTVMLECEGTSTRLADYVVIIEFDETQIRHGSSVGNIVQRFPKYDWSDISLSPSLEVFSQPQGWALSTEMRPVCFFANTLTDIMGARQYACCLQVYEPCGDGIEEVDDTRSDEGPSLFKPKVIVILSRFPFFDLFRNCLNRILLALLESDDKAELMISTLLSQVYLTPGMPAVSFCLGNDRFSVRAPKSPTIPVTSDKVTLFLQQLGTIYNILTLLCAVMTDHKILFRSSSLSLLADSCYALRSLLYPFDYPHTYVPVLPELLIEYLESPTPYIMGVLNTVRIRYTDLDAVIVDLDVGAVYVPPSITIPVIPQPFHQQLTSSLQMVLFPGLATADYAWKVGQPPFPACEVQDKRIRACFLRFFADLLVGYRCCLEVIRVYTPPLIVFHKSAFLGLRQFSSCPLIRAFLDSLLFQSFISDRGLPFRICDLFDELVAQISEQSNGQLTSRTTSIETITETAEKLLENERQETPFSITPFVTQQRFTVSFSSTKLRLINDDLVSQVIKRKLKTTSNKVAPVLCPRRVHATPWIIAKEERMGAVSRRLQVLSSCLHHIFDFKLSDARKIMCAVELSMRSVNARVAFCQLLWKNLVPVNRATLFPQQFELIVRLMNCALSQESREDEHGIAYAMLYLSNIYCRRLTAGVHQFAYTCIQEHAVWDNQQFWEAAFFHDIHRQIRRLYLPAREESDCPFPLKENVTDTWNLMEKPSGMDLVSDQLASMSSVKDDEIEKRAIDENSIVYGQAKHYINLMVYMRVPLDVSKLRRVNVRELERRSDRSGKKRDFDEETELSVSESEVESGFIEADSTDLGNSTVRWISRLIDRICSSAGLEQLQIESLCGEIPGFVALHIDNLEQVYTESKRLSPLHKPKLLQPALLLPSERIVIGGLRVFLLADGRVTSTTCGETPQSLLPAEGAIFLTNYRVVFKGQPCDLFLCEQVVVRSMTVMSITKEKLIGDTSSQSSQLEGIPVRVAHQLHDAFQIRSSSFQLMKFAFDEEVPSEKAEEFMETLSSLRWASVLPHTLFAYSAASSVLSSTLGGITSKHKYGTMKELKKALMRNPLKERKRFRAPPKALPSIPKNGDASTLNVLSPGASPHSSKNDYLDLSGEMIDPTTSGLHRHYLVDYDRLGLNHGSFRLTNANRRYELTKSYPNIIVVPANTPDDNFTKIGKGFRHCRFPVITWKSDNGALLARGAGFTAQTVVSRLRKQANFLGNSDNQNMGYNGSYMSLNSRDMALPNSVELQERYVSMFAALSPRMANGDGHSLMSESVESLLSLYSMITADGLSLNSGTPDLYRKSQTDIARHAANFVRNSGGRSGIKPDIPAANGDRFVGYVDNNIQPRHTNLGRGQTVKPLISLTRKALYVLGDRNQAKMLKLDKRCEFIPVNYPSAHNVKIAFKKFLRAACPSWPLYVDPSLTFLKQIDESLWLHMVSSLLHLACAIVDLIDVQLSTVVICIEDGWDATCQLTALSELLLDPYYRTFEGFRVLVEKEWLAFGHRFSHRHNHTAASQSSGIAPMFLLFLDAVHQTWEQYPSAFEFNDFYLRFLAYHSTSACFRTFLHDSEAERIKFDSLTLSAGEPRAASLWTYIDQKRLGSPLFDNFMYVAEMHTVLRPQSSVASITLWPFYCEDHLAHGSPYDIETAEMEQQQREDEHQESLVDVGASVSISRRLLDANYRCTHFLLLDSFSSLIERFIRLRPLRTSEDEKAVESWHTLVVTANDRATQISCFRNDDDVNTVSIWHRYVQRAVQKKETVKLLLHGISRQQSSSRLRDSTTSTNSGHHFVTQQVTPGDACAVCHQNVPGVVVRTVHRCLGCGMVCHEKCSALVSSTCPNMEEKRLVVTAKCDIPPVSRRSATYTADTRTLTMSASCPHAGATYSGFLMKKGATFKMWKPRWFVLDSNRHQLRYYENETDMNCRGVIDLADVKSVEIAASHALRKPLLEVRTSRRAYSLLADTKADADLWLEKILAALHD
uniref:Myotubularin-related protein 5 n=1 Tax=Onchocerca volvulus TaxID=6282 RepID=A0A8R1TTB5_ONCVO